MAYKKSLKKPKYKQTGAYKKFSSDLHDVHHPRATLAVMEHFSILGLTVIPNPDLYGPDLLVYRKGLRPTSYVEVEVKLGWKSGEFPFKTLNLSERKGKFVNLGLPIEFWVLRDDLQMAVVIPETSLLSSRLIEVPNRIIESGEMFFQIPLEECMILDLVSADTEGDASGTN